MANLIKISGGSNAIIQGKALFTATPTYNIGRSLSAVNEGSSVTFTLSTTNVSNGTVLPYTITGISANDVTTGSLTGTFTVNSGLATTTITMSADQLTEGAETATLTLNNAAASNFVIVNDTSLTPNQIFSPDQINGLVGWYDYTNGVYKTSENVPASVNETVAKWANKISNLTDPLGGHLIQDTLANQPILMSDSIRLNSKRLTATLVNSFSSRTYYMVGLGNTAVSGASSAILASSASTITSSFRNALASRNSSGTRRYGLSQGTIQSSSFEPSASWNNNPQIISVSFGQANVGKIKINNSTEETLSGIGNNLPSSSTILLGATTASNTLNVKEILVYDTEHTTEQKTQVINYLNAKYNTF